MNRFRDLYAREHKELELLRTRHESSIAEHKLSVTDISQQSSIAVAALQTKCAQLQQLVTELENSHSEAIRKITRENHELHMRLKVATEENSELRSRCELVIVEQQQNAIAITKERKEMEARSLIFEKEKSTLIKKADTIMDELEAAQKTVHSLQARIVSFEQLKLGFDETLRDKQNEIKHCNETNDKRVAEFQKRMEDERQRANESIEKLQK